MNPTFGTHKDHHDGRDHAFPPRRRLLKARRDAMDLRADMPPVYHQRTLASCTANAIAAVMWYDLRRSGLDDTHAPSRLFIYYNERVRDGSKACNSPVSLRDGYRTVAKRGACHEDLWPYRVARFFERPPAVCYRNALKHRAIRYMRIKPDLRHLLACVADGFPFTFGMTVYKSFMNVKKNGLVPMPKKGEKLLGGHAMVVVGYQEARRRFIVRNSWGRSWGEHGHCYMPYGYMLDDRLAWDFWTVRSLSPLPPSRRHK